MSEPRLFPALFGFAALLGLAFAAPLLPLGDPFAQDLMAPLQPASRAHWLGTDHLGRDLLARLLHGARFSLGLALTAMGAAYLFGLLFGLVAAWAGHRGQGWIEALMMRFTDLMLAVPGMLLALILAGLMGGGALPVLLGIGLSNWPQFARLARALAAPLLLAPHIEASRLAGLPAGRILWHQVLPVLVARTLPLAMLMLGGAVAAVASLGFLGLGVHPPRPEWGAMIIELFPYLHEAPLQVLAPCAALFITVLACLGFGRALAGWLEPELGR